MKAVLLAGGFGTRLRPLTLNTPKPVVPIFDRPFLRYQVALLKQLPDIDEVVVSLSHQPEQIERVLGDGSDQGLPLRYEVEPTPLGTGGAIKYATRGVEGTVLVFNGDVLTDIDLPSVVAMHRERQARATIVLTPVDNPAAYGLVETDDRGNVTRFLEKPDPNDITCDTINAGIYVLESDTFDRIPPDTPWSVERQYFPSLVERGETFVAYVDRGYWLDIGTPEKYLQAHHDIMSGECVAYPFAGHDSDTPLVAPDARVDADAHLEGPCFIGSEARVDAGARVAPFSVVGPRCTVGTDAVVDGAVLWPESTIGAHAHVDRTIIGRGVQIGSHATVGSGTVVGDQSQITSYSRLR